MPPEGKMLNNKALLIATKAVASTTLTEAENEMYASLKR